MPSRRLFFPALLAVLLLSKLLLSLLIFQEPKRAFVNDEYGYEDLALTILHDHSYTPRDDPGLGLIRPPGYPLLVAAVYSVAGQVPGAVILVQLIVGALTSLVIYRIGARLFSESAGILAAIIFALSPQATVVSLYLLTDTLFTLLLSTSFYCLVRYLQDSRNNWIFLSGLLFGILAMVRPVGFYLFIIWMIFIIASKPRHNRLTQAWKPALLFAVGFFVLVFPWMWRNYGLSGRVIFTTADAQNMFCCYAPAALAADKNISIAQARERSIQLSRKFESCRYPASLPSGRCRDSSSYAASNGLCKSTHSGLADDDVLPPL
jgi:asparagine N-glycosylation enzyme membrane subunit Stt3